jgi:hypothetical protein
MIGIMAGNGQWIAKNHGSLMKTYTMLAQVDGRLF